MKKQKEQEGKVPYVPFFPQKRHQKFLLKRQFIFALTMQPVNPNTLPSVLKNMPLASSIHCQQHQVLILKTIRIV
jgi:hypothetical protein